MRFTLFSFILCVVSVANALHFYLDANQKRCFIEELPTDTVVEGKHFPLHVWRFSLLPQVIIVLVSCQNNRKHHSGGTGMHYVFDLWYHISEIPVGAAFGTHCCQGNIQFVFQQITLLSLVTPIFNFTLT